MADDVSIWPLVAIRGDVNYVAIGARTNIQDGSVLHVTHKSSSNPEGNPLIIGEEVTVGHKVMLHGCTIGNRVLVGMGSILLDGVVVEDDVMIGAGSPSRKQTAGKRLSLFWQPGETNPPPDGGGAGRSALFSKQLCEMEKRLSGSGDPHPALIIFLLVADQCFSFFFQIPAMETKRGQPLLRSITAEALL